MTNSAVAIFIFIGFLLVIIWELHDEKENRR
jgi:hypothetical protein